MKGSQKVGEDIRNEFIGIVNYSIIALIQLEKGIAEQPDLENHEVQELYEKYYTESKELMKFKNHDYGETGEIINAKTSNIFLQSIFFKNSPLHDGAVIITGDTIKAARCVLPTIENDSFPSNLGMRHRAAAGITENTDSIAVVVSEERGKISVAYKGQLEISLSADQLKEFLQKELHQ